MNERYETYDEEMEIDLIDFLFYLLRRWKSLVAMILLGAVLGSAFYVVKTTKSANVVVEDYQPDADTEANMKLAAQYRRLYDQQIDYNEHSIIMQMDPNQVYEGTLTYYLVAGEQAELLGQLYTNVINDENVIAELKKAAGLTCDDQYVKELISCTTSKDTVNENRSLSGSVVNDVEVIMAREQVSNTVITYQIDYLDKETCEKMTEVLQSAIESATQEYETMYGAYTFDELQTTVAVTVDQKCLDQQRTSATLVDNYLTKSTNLENGFSDTEKSYYETVYLKAEKEEMQPSESENGISVKDLIKWLVVGSFGFVVLWGAYYFFKYLLDPSIKTLDEIKNIKLPIMGYIREENMHMGLLDRMQYKKNGSSDSVDYVTMNIKTLSEEHILICMDSNDRMDRKIEDTLRKDIPNMVVVNWIHQDAATLEQAKAADGIIFEICLRKTSMKQLQRALDICKIQKIKVLGVIVIEEK